MKVSTAVEATDLHFGFEWSCKVSRSARRATNFAAK